MSAPRPLLHRILSAALAALLTCTAPGQLLAQAGGDPSAEAAPDKDGDTDATAASTPPPLAEALTGSARTDYESGRALFNDGDNAGAKLKFESAYEASKDPRLLWNIAACEKNLRNYSKVLDLLERYLAEADERVSEEQRARAVELKKTMSGFVADVTIRVSQPGAQVSVDGESLGQSPLAGAIRMNQGTRKLRVEKAGFESTDRTLKVRGGQPLTVEVKLLAARQQARLRVSAGQGQRIVVDRRNVGSGEWEGLLAPGSHTLEVSAKGMRTYRSEFILEPKETKVARVTLDPIPQDSGGSLTPWLIGGGAAVAVGLGIAAFFIFKKPEEKTVPEASGSLPPGVVYLSF